jgi:hypothetical protein
VSTLRGTRDKTRSEFGESSAGVVSRGRLDSSITVLAIKQALAELGIRAKLSDIVRKARFIEKGISQSRSRATKWSMCAE